MDQISSGRTLNQWVSINPNVQGQIKVIFDDPTTDAAEAFEEGSSDNYIVDCALTLSKAESNKLIIMISNDINLRLKAKSLE